MADERNPYDPPQAAVGERANTAEAELAGRGQRFAAAMIDTIIAFAVAIPLMNVLGIWGYVAKGVEPPFTLTLLSAALGLVVFVVIHGYLLAKSGQTVGKRLLGIRIVDLQDKLVPLPRLLGLRYLPMVAANIVPGIGPFLSVADALFIFRSDRRCVHDLIAGTRVIRVQS